uniref:GW182 middle domain-containing protein n=1 Tax=Romanomermis culicivorax TaxID=13658 RepID=A0A915IIW8_ROMCU
MWDQPTEPTLVGAPVGHPDGSFGLSTGASTSNGVGLWDGPHGRPSSSAANSMMQQQNMPKSDVGGGPSGWGTPPKQQPPPTGGSWNAPPPQMKNGIIGGSGGAGNGWGDTNVAQNVGASSGWGAPTSATTPGHSGQMWNGVSNSNSQWDAPNNAGPTNNSWSQIASKNVQNSSRNKPNSFEPSGPTGNAGGGWGSHQVDQGTPWCSSNDSGARPKDWSSMNAGSGWGDPNKEDHIGGGHHHHQMGPGGMPPPGATSWQQPPPLHHQSSMIKDVNKNDGGAPYWKSGGAPTNSNGPPPHVHRTGSTSGIQWGEPQRHVTSGSGWDSLPPQAHRSWNLPEPATPSNVWTGPPADSCVDSSMVWNNPNPKKVAQPDKGTNVWGDPNSQQQQEIRRWKSSDENVIHTPMANAPPCALPQQSAATTSIFKETHAAPGAGTAKQATPQPAQQPNIHQSSSTNWLAGGGDNKSAGQPPQQLPPQTQDLNGTSIWDSMNNKSAPTGLSGWNSAAQNDSHWGSAPKLLDNDVNADDVFSANPLSLSQKNGLNANYQRMSQQSQSHLMQQQQNVKLLQNSQSMPIPQIDSQTGNKIIDQLKAAATAGLIDANLAQTLIEKSAANNRLAQETVVRMCYILQYLPKLEQAQRELQTIRNQNNPPLNEAQNQEIRRLTNEVNQYQSAVQTLKAQVNANLASLEKSSSATAANDQGLARPSSSANITGEASRLLGKDPVSPQSNVSNNTASDSLNQSKLLQWKNGNSISSNSEDSDKNKPALVTTNNSVSSSINGSSSTITNNNIATSPSMSNLESLVQSMASASLSGGGVNDSTSLTNNDMWMNQEMSLNSKRETNSWPKMAGGDSAMKSDEHSRETTPNDSQNNGDLQSKENVICSVSNGPTTDESQNRMQQNVGIQGRDGLLAPIGVKNSDEGPPEFRPGQKWLWKDPKEVAEDPNATPGSIKPSSLTLNTNFNLPPLGPSLGGAFGGASLAFNNSPFGGFQSQQQQHNQQPLFGGFHSQSNNNLGLLNQQQVQQQQHHYHGFSAMNSLFGNPSNKINDDFKIKQQNADFFAASRMTPAPGVGRMPPSGMPNQGATGPLPFAARPPMIKPQFSMPNAFVPYAQQQQQWIALAITNCSQIDENHLALLVKNYGTTISYVSPPGSGMAFVKFRDVPLDRILHILYIDGDKIRTFLTEIDFLKDCYNFWQSMTPPEKLRLTIPVSGGVTIQMAKESEVERLLQVFNSGASARQQPPLPPMFGAGGPNSATPGGPPPMHHLGGGGSSGMLWDAPPPPVGPWGAAAASFGGPPPNLPLAPPNDPMAQLMQQQLGGDGLLGGDRHPF